MSIVNCHWSFVIDHFYSPHTPPCGKPLPRLHTPHHPITPSPHHPITPSPLPEQIDSLKEKFYNRTDSSKLTHCTINIKMVEIVL
ncbi:hypothetical protein [Fischerella thermalis]|uniref:hypothetical protein n=1 Tax=Fischerella thermalis TaxID=372787 RepID=UPI0011AF8F7C|nr:hypothetical protein [Fischerella thermalis]